MTDKTVTDELTLNTSNLPLPDPKSTLFGLHDKLNGEIIEIKANGKIHVKGKEAESLEQISEAILEWVDIWYDRK